MESLIMDNNNKGLADNQDGEIILNESGTSISTDVVEGQRKDEMEQTLQADGRSKEGLTLKTADPVALNDIASDENSRQGEGIIKPYDDVFGDHKPHEDSNEISSTDDV
jgi:hypothetical protein